MKGRTAVVTGGGRGVGAAVAAGLARAGARVVVAARTRTQVDAVAASLRAEGHDALPETCDVADPTSVDALAARTAERLGAVDILVNNAGTAMAALVHKTSLDDWNRLMAVNATGAFLCMKAFVPGMLERQWGRVINVASIAGLSADRYMAAYAASKHALVGLTRAAAAEAAAHGVTVNAVCPGFLDTGMTDETIARIVQRTGRTDADARAAILGTMPQHRLVDPEEVAAAVLFLCGDAARGVNGETLVIDGGQLRR